MLLNDCVVHRISEQKKDLRKAQEKKPIKTEEVFSANSFVDIAKRCDIETSEHTVNFSWLLKDEYQKTINLPKEICTILKEINEERNRLHFIAQIQVLHNKEIIDKYNTLIEFVAKTIKPCLEDLDKTTKPPEKN